MEKKKKQSEFMDFVENELDILGSLAADKDQIQAIKKAIIPLCKLFESFGRIGGAKSKILLRLFAKLAAWMPLTPLLGTDDEWELVKEGELEDTDIQYQNKRCPHIYKRKDGTAFNSQATVFSYNGLVWFRTKDSNENIDFPYIVPVSPKRIRLEKDNGDPSDEMHS